jgi:hypothetical protein
MNDLASQWANRAVHQPDIHLLIPITRDMVPCINDWRFQGHLSVMKIADFYIYDNIIADDGCIFNKFIFKKRIR